MNMPHRSERMSVKKFMNEFENKQLKEIPKMNNVDIGTVPLNDSSAIAIVPNDDVQTDGKISKVVPNECMVVNTSVSVPKNIDKIVPTEREQRMIFYDVSDESSDETYEDIKPKAVNVKEIKKLNIKRTKKALAALKKKRESKKKQCDCFL